MPSSSAPRDSLELLRDDAWMRGHYHVRGMARREIARLLGVADSTVGYWLERHGIDRRTVREARGAQAERTRPPELADRGWLHDRIHIDHLSISAIGGLIGVSPSAVRTAMRRLGVESVEEILADRDRLGEWVNRDGVPAVAAAVGRSASTVYRRLKAHRLRTDGTPHDCEPPVPMSAARGTEWLIAVDSVRERTSITDQRGADR